MSTPNLTDDAVIERDEVDMSLFWHEHKVKLIVGVLAVVGVIGGGFGWYIQTTLARENSQAALADAKDVPQFEAVAKNFQGTPAAADALLLVAGEQQKAGNPEASTAAFQQFLKLYPKHPLAGGALLGIAQNLDAAGQPAEAMTIYEQITEKYPKSYAAPFAAYARAEILLRDFRREEARIELEGIVSQFPESIPARMAAARLAQLGAKP